VKTTKSHIASLGSILAFAPTIKKENASLAVKVKIANFHIQNYATNSWILATYVKKAAMRRTTANITTYNFADTQLRR
jgi:hypothetical protein